MPKSLTVVYAGTPAFAVPALDALLQAGYHVAAIYTQPDRPAGRGRQLQSSPVKQFALTQRIPVYQPVSLRNAEAQRALAALRPDLMIVTAYGLLLPSEVLALPRLGCVNIHASLLPRWRGAAPIQRAILAGDSETGITLMQMDVGLDTGDILWQRTLPIIPGENAQQLHDRLAQLGAQCLLDALPELAAGSLLRRQQAAAQVSYAAKLRKEEAWLDWRQAAEQLARQVCAFNPWPVAQTGIPKTSGCAEVLRIWQAEALPHPSHVLPGTVLAATKTGVDVACGQGVLRLQCLQRAGGRPQAAAEFINACDLRDICLVSEG